MLLPAAWTLVSPSDMDFDTLLDEMGEILDSEVLERQAREAYEQGGKLFAFDFLGGTPGFADNISIVELPLTGFPAVTIEAATVQLLESLVEGAEVSSEIRDVPAGEAIFIWYRLPAMGAEGISATVLTDTTQWVITYGARDTGPLADVFETMVDSFRETP